MICIWSSWCYWHPVISCFIKIQINFTFLVSRLAQIVLEKRPLDRCLFVMVALWNRADHYIFALWFLLSFFFFPRLISALADWMSAILPHMVCGLSANLTCRSETFCTRLAENTERKKVAKNRHLGTIAQFCRAMSSQPRHVSTIRTKLVKQQYVIHMSS